MVILSIDYGDVRTGMAVCDALELIASPIGTIVQRDRNVLVREILRHINERGAGMIVVGMPKNMDGSEGFRAQATYEFVAQLKAATGIPVETWDERLTTVAAGRLLNETGTYGKKRKNIIDTASAVMILQDFIAHRKNMPRQAGISE